MHTMFDDTRYSRMTLYRIRFAACLFLYAWLSATGIVTDACAEAIRFSNKALRLGINSSAGRITELTDLAAGHNFVSAGTGGLWLLELDATPTMQLSPSDAHAFRMEKLRQGDPGYRLIWSRFDLADAPDLQVEVVVRLDRKRTESRWSIAILEPGKRSLTRIRFPRLLNLAEMENERLVLPFWVGLMAENPRKTFSARLEGVRREYDYPGLSSLQCMSYYREGGAGLYASTDDTAGYRKSFAVFSEPGAGLNLEIVHLPEGDKRGIGRYAVPYSVRLGTFQGNWYDSAAIYRSWALQQAWARESRWKGGSIPSWISDTGLWVWNRGRSSGVLGPAVALQQASRLPVSVFWHWWHGCAYDTGFPEYLPPREGEGPFRAALEKAHTQDVHALVYMNQRLWGMTTESWKKENAADYAVKGTDGKIRPEVYNTFTRQPCATMCMGTDFWRRKYSGLAIEAFNRLGVDGIYMDQACTSLSCYDRSHGHPLGGGTYWMNGFKTMAADIRRQSTERGGIALAGEGCAENWLPYLDLMLALDVSRERYAGPDGWEVIPFFHAVYHGYGIFYGNYSSLTMPPYDDLWPEEFAPKEPLRLLDRKFSTQFYLEQARSFVWGQQPTIANFQPSHLRERAEEIDYLVRIARLRRLALKYLQDGAMLPPPRVEAPESEIPMSRLSIYAGQRDALKEFRKTVPLVLAASWRAADGNVAIAIASIADQPLASTLVFDADRYGLPQSGFIRGLSEQGAEPIGRFRGKKTVTLRLDLHPRDIRILELTTAKEGS